MIDIGFTSMRSRFDYGPDAEITVLEMELPHRFVNPIDETLGGRRIASAGIGASFIVRRDQMWSVTLRFRESDWDSVLDMIEWGQSEESFTWYPDADDLTVSYQVYLHSPAAGMRVQPTRNAEYPWMQELTIELRRQIVEITGPDGYPTCNGVETGGTFADVTVGNNFQEGNETLEIWARRVEAGSGGTSSPAPGVLTGATDFSEFSTGLGIPTGITAIHPNTTPPSSQGIGNDPTEGNYFQYTPEAFEAVAYIFDAFSGISAGDDIELLARIWIPAHTTNRRIHGPAFQLAGTNQTDLDYAGGGVYMRSAVDYESTAIDSDGGSAGVVIQSDWQEAETTGVWVWQRVRIIQDGAATDWYIKTWTGNLAAEPASWDGQSIGGAKSVIGNDAIGWAVTALVRRAEQRIAYLSFTTDPTYEPPTELPEADPEWELIGTVAVTLASTQLVTLTGLDPSTEYEVAFRYRRDGLYSPGASGDNPSIWPSVSRCTFTTTIDPPSALSAEWERTGAADENITLTMTPADPDADINIYRRTEFGSLTLIDTIVGPHVGDVEYEDDTISGETAYWYAVSSDTGSTESPLTDEVRIWAGPAGIPTYEYQITGNSGYWIGFTPGDESLPTEVHDNYDDAGGLGAFNLRETDPAGDTEIFSGTLANTPSGEWEMDAKLRHKQTSFTVDDFGEFTPNIDLTMTAEE